MTEDLIKTKANEALQDAVETFGIIEGYKLTSDAEFTLAAEVLKEVKAKVKFWDQERTISVKPLNDEVKEINGWFKPAIVKLEECESRLKRMISSYQLAQAAEQRRLLQAAAEAAALAAEAHPVTASGPPPQEEAEELLGRALAAQAPRVAGVSVREVWCWELEDQAKVPEAFKSIDPRKLDSAVKGGVREIPGVRIYKDARVTART